MEMDVSVQEQIMRHPLLGVTGSLNWLPGNFTLCVLLLQLLLLLLQLLQLLLVTFRPNHQTWEIGSPKMSPNRSECYPPPSPAPSCLRCVCRSPPRSPRSPKSKLALSFPKLTAAFSQLHACIPTQGRSRFKKHGSMWEFCSPCSHCLM